MICDYCFVDMDDDGHVVVIEQPDGAMLAELLAIAGPAESVLMPKVRSPHLLPIAQENSSSGEWLLASMCARRNGRSFADTRPAMALASMMKTLSLICTRKLAH